MADKDWPTKGTASYIDREWMSLGSLLSSTTRAFPTDRRPRRPGGRSSRLFHDEPARISFPTANNAIMSRVGVPRLYTLVVRCWLSLLAVSVHSFET